MEILMTLNNCNMARWRTTSLLCVVGSIAMTILFQASSTMGFVATSPAMTSKNIGTFALNLKHGVMNVRQSNELKMSLDESLAATEVEEITEVEDKNGNLIKVGGVIRVAVEGLKAYQVPPKGHGSYNDDKEFVPAPEGGERGTKNLKIPIGLRGEVTLIYDTEAISSNLPVRVKFSPGKNVDEGYDPPVAFLMHFMADEVEII